MKEIAIIGGGIGGLTLAICLKNSGYQCHIYEKNTEFREVGAAISVFPNALKVFQAVGLLDNILRVSGVVENVFLKTQSGRILSKSSPHYDLPTICLHRTDLHTVLLENVKAELHTHHQVASVETLDTGKVNLVFTNGTHKTVDAVVGADGLHSVIRQQIINDGSPVFRGYSIWRGVCEMDLDAGYGSETYGNGKRVGIVPIKDGQFGWWATLNEPFMQSDEPEGSRQRLLTHFSDWHYPIPELIRNTKHILKNSLTDRVPVRGWSKGMAVLLGDAAHPTTPNLGQGGCMAIEGAYILAKCIDTYGLTPAAFARYEKLHFPRAERIVKASLQLGEIGQLENRAICALRNLLISIVPARLNMKLIDSYFAYDVTKLVV